MSASKKKRLGSQRRSLNPNVQESSQTSDKAMSPSLAPQGRQRSDANADLTLSTGSAESGTSERKKKLGSQRGNQGKLQFKDVSESSNEPKEEVEGSTTHSEPMDTLAIKNETTDLSLERTFNSINPESEEAGSDLVLGDALNASLSITDAISSKADIQNTNMDSTSELLLKAESEKYLAEITSSEEGVLSEKGHTQGVPDIFGGPIPAGVIEEGTCPVRLTQNEELNILGSHDDYNKHDTEDKAGPIEKPVSQDHDKSALPTAKPRKMGSSRRKKVIDTEVLQEQGNQLGVESNIVNTLEITNPTNVENTQEVDVSIAAPEVTYKEESQEKNKLSPKENLQNTDEVSEVGNSMPEIKEYESSPTENVSVEMKGKDDQMEDATHDNEQLAYLQNSDLSEISFKFADGKYVNIMDQPEPSITDGLSIVYGQASKEKDQDEAVNHTDEQLVQKEELFDSSLQISQSVNSAPFSALLDVSVNDVEAKILEIEDGSSQPLNSDSVLHHDKTATAATVVQEPISESDTQNFVFDRSESSSESDSSAKDETVESFFGSLQEQKPSVDGALHLNQDDVLNLSSTTESTSDNEAGLAATTNVHQITTSSVSETLEDHEINLMFESKIEDVKNDNLLGQQSEPQMSNTDGGGQDQEEATLTYEQLVDIPSEPERPLKSNIEEINTSLISPFPIVASIDDVTSSWNDQDKTMDVISRPDIEEIQDELIFEEQGLKASMTNKDQAGGQHEMDIASIQAHDESMDNDNEVTAAVRGMTSPNDKLELDQMKEKILEVGANIIGLGETVVDDETEQFTSNEYVISEVDKDGDQRKNVVAVQIPHTDDFAQQDATASVGDDTAGDSQLIENRRTQDNDELKLKGIDIKIEMAMDDEDQAAVPDELDKSFTEVHNETLSAVEPLKTNDESLKPTDVTSLFGAEQIADDEILNITDKQVLDTTSLEQNVEESPKPEENNEQSDVNTESYSFKQTVNVHQLTYISDSETHEEMDNNKDQTDRQQEMDITSIRTYDESMEAAGETTGSVLSDSHVPLKEQTNVHQLFSSSDHEDLKYSAKPTDGTEIEQIKELSKTQLSTEQPPTIETTGESFENVQTLDLQINAPDTDPHRGPVRKKFGSSRRSKGRKDDTATVYKEDPLNTENQNLTSSINVQTDTQCEPIKTEENIKADNEVTAAVRELTSPSDKVEVDQMKEKIIEVEADILGLDETVVDEGTNQTEQCTSNVADKDIASVGDGVVADSKLIRNRRKLGSSRRRRDNDELKQKDIDIKIEMAMDDENQAAVADKLDKSFTQALNETLEAVEPLLTTDESLKPAEVAEQVADADISNVTVSQVLDTEVLEQTVKESPEPEDIEQSEINTESRALKQTVNVHQLTYISDSETHEEMDNSFLQQAKQQVLEETMGEMPENSALISKEENISDSDAHKSLRRKLGSSRRAKGGKLEAILSDCKDTSNDNEDTSQVSELTEPCPVEEISINLGSELDTEPINQSIFTKSDTERIKDSELLLLLDKDPTVDPTQEQERVSEEKTNHDTQKQIPDVEVDSFTIKDLKDKDLVQPKVLPRDVGVDSTTSSVAESEEITDAKADDAIQSFAMSTKGTTKEQEGTEVMEVLEVRPELPVNSEPKRRKMGSTRRSQLNRKQQDEEINADDSATILLKKDITPTVSENAQILSSDIFENEGQDTISADQIENQHLNEDIAESQEVTQEDKEKILQTKTELVEDLDKGATMQTLLPVSGEEIQPSSPGKKRKMGSTRKNLSSKRESPQAESVTPENSEKEVASISNEKENKENSGLLVYTATVHQPPADEDTPINQPVSQEKMRSDSKEAELSSQHEAMSEDAAVARRRKMGSHRKPHSDQSIREETVTDTGENLLHPLREMQPKLTQISEVKEGDNKALSSASAFNTKLNSRPVSEKISQQPSLQSTNINRVQERNIRISAGLDRSASRYEVVMIGDSSVGKTSFIQRAQSGKFSLDIPASIGMDSFKWTVAVNGKTIVLHLWDTAGQERFRSMTKQIFHRAQAFLLMYDVTCVQTFTAVSYWANCIKDGAAENAVVLLLGNKCDRTERKVRREDGEILAEENSFAFMECSAATGENVTEALEMVARLLSQKADRSEEPLILRKPEPKNKLGCC